jgi:hypothetical protein
MARLPGAVAGARIVGESFAHSRRLQDPEGRMPLLDHLRELRNRVVKMALALVAGMSAGFVFFDPAWHVIERPLCAAHIRNQVGCHTLGVNQLVLNGPLDAFYRRQQRTPGAPPGRSGPPGPSRTLSRAALPPAARRARAPFSRFPPRPK